ncbi:NAD(P)-dependent alcohol dehydrogenase [Rhizobium sp. LEGMi135b]
MKRIQYYQYGGPEQMKLESFELRPPGKGEVAVKVNFASVNPIDWKVRSGYLKMMTGKTFPRSMGSDMSGVVTAIGLGVTRFKRGDAVFGSVRIQDGGALGEAAIAPETFLARKPDGLSFEDAASLGTPGITAWNGIVDKAKVAAGQHVFINGCAGAVGEAAVQLALALGAAVAGSCSASAMQRMSDLGVKPLFDYRTTTLAKVGDRFDVVYDTAGTMDTATAFGLLRPGGVFLDINPTPGKFIRAIFSRKFKPIVCTARADVLDGIAKAAQMGKLRLPIGEIVLLNDAIRAITALESGHKSNGKVLVRMD